MAGQRTVVAEDRWDLADGDGESDEDGVNRMDVFAALWRLLVLDALASVHAVARAALRYRLVRDIVLADGSRRQLGHAPALIGHAVAPPLLHGHLEGHA